MGEKWYPEAFYLLAMIDYLSRLQDIPQCTRYDDIRRCSLQKTLYLRDIAMAAKLDADLDIREQSKQDAIPEFMRFNIVENEVCEVF